jgi:hypothetical protein
VRDTVAPFEELTELVSGELSQAPPPAAAALAEAIVGRHGSSVASVLFYGSCLRKTTHEGVLDFYVVIDGYRSFYGLGWFATANAALPPNVFYLESQAILEEGASPVPVRCKYAVLSTAAFKRLTSPRAFHPYIWARFAQPALIAWARDDDARRVAETSVANAVRTFVKRLSPFLPADESVSFVELWQDAFRRTYRTEFRSESSDRGNGLHAADPERYAAATTLALKVLQQDGVIHSLNCRADSYDFKQSPAKAFAAKLRWQITRPIAKGISIIRLLKTATTFGDWLPYALWKLERHSGIRPELTDRQRKHPLIFAWPVILRLITKGALR